MLKFTNDRPIYDVDEACIVFTGMSRLGPVSCQVTKSAVLERAGLADADTPKLLAAFARHRLFFEDIACVLHVRGVGRGIMIDEGHLSESEFVCWQSDSAAPAYGSTQRSRQTPAQMTSPHHVA